ncbi:MAG: hypothetical protein UDB11_06945 [Peptococcaceae bacterium]|nr:hypothetical protein [Peptococcaceae bacterium]
MTSRTSYNSLGKNVRDQLHKMRSFILLLAVLYLGVGPIWLFLELSSYQVYGELALLGRFYSDYFTPYYLIAIGIGTLGAFYATRYQDVPSQSNFYHSLPITRSGLLNARVLAVVLVQVLLLLTVTAVDIAAAAVIAGQLGGTALVINLGLTAVVHFVNIMLVFLLTFALALFAGQLTANTVGQAIMTVVLHLTVPVVTTAIMGMVTLFNDTVDTIGSLEMLGRFNILTAFSGMRLTMQGQLNSINPLFMNVENAANYSPNLALWPLGTLVCYLVLIVFFFAATYWLYKRRAVEKAGDTLMYPLVGSVVKGIYVFLAGVLSGVFFWNIIGETLVGFIIGAVLGMIVVHLIAEMIYSMDVDGVRRNYVSSLVGLVCALALCLSLQTGLVNPDEHLPKADSVNGAAISINNQNDFNMNVKSSAATDPTTIQTIMKAADELQAVNVTQDDTSDTSDTMQDLVAVQVAYDTTLGGKTERYFTVTMDDAKTILAPVLDNAQAMKTAWSSVVDAKADDIVSLSVIPSLNNVMSDEEISLLPLDGGDYKYQNTQNIDAASKAQAEKDRERAEALLAAMQKDLDQRNSEVLATRVVAMVSTGMRTTNEQGVDVINWGGNYLNIYAGDKNTVALLNKWREEGFLPDERSNLQQLLKGYSAIVYDPSTEKDTQLGTLSTDALIDAYLAGDLLSYDQVKLYGVKADDPSHLVVGICDGAANDADSSIVANLYVRDGAELTLNS